MLLANDIFNLFVYLFIMKDAMDFVVHHEFKFDSGAVLHENRVYRRWHHGLYEAKDSYHSEVSIPSDISLAAVRINGQEELYRAAIVDDKLPLSIWDRLLMIYDLGLVKYRKAAPEFREVFLHDVNESNASCALGSLVYMGCEEIIPDLIDIVRNRDKTRTPESVEALGKFRHKPALPVLIGYYEDMVYAVRKGEFSNANFGSYSSQWTELINVMTALLRIGGELPKRFFMECLNGDSVHAYHAATRANFWSKFPYKDML